MGHENEDEEWEMRQKQTGAAGRLVIYEYGDKPRDDIMLRGGSGRRIMVTAVSDDGKADRGGVKAGDVLVSINGKKDFIGHSADYVHTTFLVAPVVLVFMGFVGKLQAEVRLNYSEDVAGMALKENFLARRPEATVHIIEEVVFMPSTTRPLFISTGILPKTISKPINPRPVEVPAVHVMELSDNEDHMHIESASAGVMISGSHSLQELPTPQPVTSAVYELHASDARHLVRNALSRTQSSATTSGDDFGSVGPALRHQAKMSISSHGSDGGLSKHRAANTSPPAFGEGSTLRYLNSGPPLPMKPSADSMAILEPSRWAGAEFTDPTDIDDDDEELMAPIYKTINDDLYSRSEVAVNTAAEDHEKQMRNAF